MRRRSIAALMLCALAAIPGAARAQRPDSTRVVVPPPSNVVTRADTIAPRPPLSPRRAFFYSLIAPGYSQAVLGRHKAAALILLFEGVAISMIRETGADIREARRNARDTVLVVGWNDTVPRTVPGRFNSQYVSARRSHLEDWIAVLVANHVFAGADAYVAAHLWDVPAQLSIRATPDGARVAATFTW